MNSPEIEAIYNFFLISPDIATAGQPTRQQLEALAKEGFTTVINLLPDNERLPEEPEVVRSLGMTYHQIPIAWESPTLQQFQEFQKLLALHTSERILLHCAANKRVSAFVYLHRLSAGEPESVASVALHHIWKPNRIWSEFIATIKCHF